MKRIVFLLLGTLAGIGGPAIGRAADDGSKVVVVYNTRVPESKGVAEHYMQMRHVPASQVVALDLPVGEAISREDFHDHFQKPLLKEFDEHGWFHFETQTFPATATAPRRVERKVTEAKIRYLVLVYGVPLQIVKDASLHEEGAETIEPVFRNNGAAADSELACLPVIEHMMFAGTHRNPGYACTNAGLLDPTNGMLIVARVDGPTAAIARSLVDKAMEAETNGLWGRAYFDGRGLPTNDPVHIGDEWIFTAGDLCRRVGFETIIDSNYGTFSASFPLSQVAFYAGWYDENASGPFARPTVEFMPGAFAYHLQSFSAATIRSTKRQWVGPLLDRGVTATMGCVDEPYLGGTPNIAIFFARFIYSAYSYGEAAYAAQPFLSWQITVVGDPLYRPFARNPTELQQDLQRRHNKLADWEYLRLVNYNLIAGLPLDKVVAALESIPATKESSVLQEKLAELYLRQGKPSSSVSSLQNALKLDPTPQQRVRLMLALAGQLQPLARDADAYSVYQDFLVQCSDYPDKVAIFKDLRDLAQKLGKHDDEQKYQREIDQIAPPHALNHKLLSPKGS